MVTSKADLRTAGLTQRDGIETGRRTAFAQRLAREGLRLVGTRLPGQFPLVVSVYRPIGSEPDTGPLAQALADAGHILALPVDWSSGSALIYRRWIIGDRLAAGPLGIAEPLETAPLLDPDVLFIPLAVFDRRGHRIGYGVGNVDRTLFALRARRSIRALGVAFAEQEVTRVPEERHDAPLDLVITDDETIACSSAAWPMGRSGAESHASPSFLRFCSG